VEYGAAGVKDQPLSPAERQEAERLCAQATRGPWDHDEEIIQARDPVVTVAFCSGRTDNDLNDAAFISQARTLLPRALATIAQHAAEVQALTQERRLFPIQSERGAAPHPTRIPWSVADKAYSVYSAQYGKDQSLERLAERGGFGPSEMDRFHPTWREEASEILKLLADVAALTQERDALKRHIEIELLPDDPGGTKANWIARCHAAEAQLREQGMRAVSTPPEPYPPFEGTEVREEIPTDE
jgi:hypothetical protein